MSKRKISLSLGVVLVLLGLNSACFCMEEAKVEKNKYPDYAYEFNGQDKFESFNRKMFMFNLKANKYVLRPMNIVWASIMPKYGMDRLKNCYTNIEYPKRVTSCLLQKDFKSSGKETVRFVINSTIGLGGMFDPAKSKFNIEPKQEDMEQALSKYKIAKGPLLVLPFASPNNIRGYAGKVFDYSLNPASYFIGPVPMMVKAGFMANRTSYAQGLLRTLEGTFADPYDIARKLYGIDNYIKNSNLDRRDVLAEIVDGQNIPKIENHELPKELKTDIKLDDYEPQCPIVDSMRTSMFEVPDLNKSMWSDLSVWNRSFSKKVKTSAVNIVPDREKYKYRYILQKDKNAPVAIIYPSIGEGVFSHHSVVFAKIFYDQGYSVIIQGSSFQWEFVKSAPADYRPGLPERDASYVRLATSKILEQLSEKEKIEPSEKIVVGTSFGALTALFVGAIEEKENILNISKYISISPPIDLFFALRKLDTNAAIWNQNQDDLKKRTAVVAGKIVQISQNIADKDPTNDPKTLPFTEEEGQFTIDFIMKQKLSDVIFTIENVSKCKKTDVYKQINDMNFNDYLEKYLATSVNKPMSELNQKMSLYSISDFLATSDKYKVYEAMDDYFINQKQLGWLKKTGSNKVVVLNNGSHLGFLYRKEFQDSLKTEIAVKKDTNTQIAQEQKPKIE